MLKKLALLTSGTFSSLAVAHPGHDHSYWTSDIIHALTIAAIIGISTVGIFLYRKKKAGQNVSFKDQEK